MESLNMNTLASSLPNSANAEKQLMDNFKAAALSITTLYRSSLDTSKRAYTAGYATCLLDVLRFVEAGVSVSENAGEEMTIGRVMDWLEARLEAIKSTEEEEEEERMKEDRSKRAPEEMQKEEREKRSQKVIAGSIATTSRLHRSSKENLHDVTQAMPLASNRSPPSPPAPVPRSITSPSPPPPTTRSTRQKRGLKELNPGAHFPADVGPFPVAITPSASFSPFTFSSDVVLPIPAVGSKRRHATMISESHASSSLGASSSPSQGGGHLGPHGGGKRKRVRGARDRETLYTTNANGGGIQGPGYTDTMEIEEECGRERKRPARR